MVVNQFGDADADRVFHGLADATRRDIVERVLREPQSVSALARRYAMSFAAVQKHVAVLERAGLVTKQRRGREQLVRGNPDILRTVARLLESYEQIWRHRARAIEDILAEDDTPERT
ncbi:ArsR/SmtB family transcription factor [Actinokineospora terrae]|uniref:ArsR/SmtB family transcription factor n=1 Tax=Actinokineospora terrae TaxID=155974 RepID=UPI000B82C3B5|nr:metalloregulator ArsR/SmtB family transcription factor [Actinokineospora terrae]